MLWRSCHRAECSLSTGRIWPGPALAITSSPAATRLSLLARARVLPARSVARVACNPAAPTTALSTTDASAPPRRRHGPIDKRRPARRLDPACREAEQGDVELLCLGQEGIDVGVGGEGRHPEAIGMGPNHL